MSKRRAVITGLGWVTPLGCALEPTWKRFLTGDSGVEPITRFELTDKYPSRIAGQIADWTGGSIDLNPRALKRIDRFAQFGLSAAIDAVSDAGLDLGKEDPFACGVLVGSGIGGIEEFEQGHAKMLNKGPDRTSPFMIPKLMINAASGNISIYYKIRGVNNATVTACASGGHAIGCAYDQIINGNAEVILAGGAEAAVTPLGVACFMTMRALSTRNDEPHRASRPFDVDRDGFVIAEGAGVVVLEEYERAKARGARIYAELCGYGMTGDGGHITAPDEQGTGAARAMVNALKMAGINKEQIGYINAHATSTSLGDLAENRAIQSVFPDAAKHLAISSTKSMIGHTLGASGGIESVICALALSNGCLPPTINLENPEDECNLNCVANQAQEHDIAYAMNNNFGFGGHNVSLVFGKV